MFYHHFTTKNQQHKNVFAVKYDIASFGCFEFVSAQPRKSACDVGAL